MYLSGQQRALLSISALERTNVIGQVKIRIPLLKWEAALSPLLLLTQQIHTAISVQMVKLNLFYFVIVLLRVEDAVFHGRSSFFLACLALIELKYLTKETTALKRTSGENRINMDVTCY